MQGIARYLLTGLMICSLAQGAEPDWPSFRGSARTNHSPDTNLLKTWPEDGPKLLWTGKGLGSGYSSVTLVGDRIYTLGNKGRSSHLVAIDRKNGDVLWSTEIGGSGGNLGSTPTVDGDHIYAIGQKGDMVCIDTKGKLIWKKNFHSDFGGNCGGWKYTESPLVDGDRVICTPGGKGAVMVALDKKSGKVIWKCDANIANVTAGYSSIVIANVNGIKLYIQLLAGGVIGVRAEDGEFLWGYEKLGRNTANIPTPIVLGDKVFCSAGYGKGGALLQMKKQGKGIDVEEVYFSRKLTNKHGGLVVVDDHIYGDYNDKGQPFCAEVSTGKVLWTRERRDGGKGEGSAAVTYADGKLYFLYQNGIMSLVDASPKAYKEISSFTVPGRGRSWAHPVVVGGRMYLRRGDDLYCYDVTAKE